MTVQELWGDPGNAGEVPLDQIDTTAPRLRRLRPEIVDDLVASMGEVGLIQPIVISEDGRIIAGLHRYEAAKKLKWETIRAVITEDRSADLMLLMEIDENLVRADLSPAERAAHHAERKKIWEREHPETRRGAPTGGRGNQHTGPLVKSQIETLPAGYARDAAQKTGVSKQTVHRDVARGGIPNVVALAGTSLDVGDELDALVKLPAANQAPLIDRAKAGEKVSAKTELKKIKRDDRERELAEATEAASQQVGQQLYGVIYADPPWRFEPRSRETGMDRAADNHYPTVGLDAIKNIEVPAAEDCVLFLWATAPMLPQALDVLEAWGFVYKTHCVWLKPRQGTGFWFRNVHEILLVGTRGNVVAPAPGSQEMSVIEAPVSRHSEKPAAFAEFIERLFPNAAKLEMFARQSRDGWDSWGNEIDQ